MKFVAWKAHHLESREVIDDYLNRVRGYLYDHEFVVCEDKGCIKREIRDADAMVCWKITPSVFFCAEKLKWIQFGSAGIDHTVFPELVASDVVLTTMSGIHAAPVAEHVLALMLALSRKLDLAMKLQIEHSYDRDEIAWTAGEMRGKTLGIIGLGKIGCEIARLASAFGMRVIGSKRTVTDVAHVEKVYPPEGLREILPQADYLALVVPLTADTAAIIGHQELGMMKDGARIINVARGAMIDHEALGEALRNGKLAGAALDVFPAEPLPADSPVYDFPNTILTPHTGSSGRLYGARAAEVFRRNLDAFLGGTEMINVYDRERGY